jgi:Ni/Fe-hydrogenase subunit HybB-like protein
MKGKWERAVPVYDAPIVTRSFIILCTAGVLACAVALYREIVGLGPSSGMNDLYAWGIWKTFNIMVLTGLGSGGFSIGIAAWIFGRHRLHTVLRTAVLSSFLVYASGLMLLGVDVARPWNFVWILMPWHWNAHSPMLEIGFCMPLYTAFPLLLENIAPALDWARDRWPELAAICEGCEHLLKQIYPWTLGLAFLLPAMHQSSLGALMLLAGNQVHPLWQTPLLPLFYVWAAAFMGFAFVMVLLLVAHLAWQRSIDLNVLSDMSRITAWLIVAWLGLRVVDVTVRRVAYLAFQPTMASALFAAEVVILAVSAYLLFASAAWHSARQAFVGSCLAAIAGMLYRFDPTTLVFHPRAGTFYFPSVIELLISVGFICLAAAVFSVLVKVLPIMPESLQVWRAMESVQGIQPVESSRAIAYHRLARRTNEFSGVIES